MKTLSETLINPSVHKIKNVVEKYAMVIAALPGVRDILITTFLKITGFTAAGVKSGTLAALIQSKVYGAYIANYSLTYSPLEQLVGLILLYWLCYYWEDQYFTTFMCTITHKIYKVHLSGKPKILLKFHNLQFQNVQIILKENSILDGKI